MSFRRTIARLCVFLVLCAPSAWAWDDVGHMTVAAIAYDRLNPAIAARVDALLKLNPQYKAWQAIASGKDAKRMAFMMAATWPDYIKRAQGYEDDGDSPKGADVAKNVGYADKLMHKYWHYVDLPFSPDGSPTQPPKTPNAMTQIRAFRQILASKSADGLKSHDLVWLEHVIGDVHQPLHATSRFTKSDPPTGDAGGNLIKVCAPACGTALHTYWDDLLEPATGSVQVECTAKKLPAVECYRLKIAAALAAAKSIKPADLDQTAILNEGVWIDESFDLAKTVAYAAPVGAGNGPFTLDDAYYQSARRIAEERAALAGARLARILNFELK